MLAVRRRARQLAALNGLGSRPRLSPDAIRRLGPRVAESWAAGIGALRFVVAAVGASIQAGLAIRGGRHSGRGLGIAFRGGRLGLRQAHGSAGR